MRRKRDVDPDRHYERKIEQQIEKQRADDEQDEETEDADMACSIHDIETLPSGYDHCPLCREERRIQEQEIHQLTRDPTLEPW